MSPDNNNLFEFGEFRINISERTLWQKKRLVPLTPKAMETLCVLVENRGRLVTKDELMEKIWADCFVEERNLTQNIFTLRKLFGDADKDKKFIETVPRRGYRFVAEVRPVETEKIQVTHHKQTRISAEGFVSAQKLTETVEKIAKDIFAENYLTEHAAPRRLETTHPNAASFPFSNRGLMVLITFLLVFGGAVLLWQNGYPNFRQSGLATVPAVSKLEFEQLTESGNALYLAISPDKQYMAYVVNENNNFRILLRHLATGSETEVVSPKNYEIRSTHFSADGNYLFYAAKDGKAGFTIYQVPIFGGTPRQTVTDVPHNFTISPDGTQFAFIRNNSEIKGNQLVVCQTDGSDERILATRTGDKYFRVWGGIPAWSPDGKKIVISVINKFPNKYNNKKSYFAEITLADGSEREINAPDWNITYQARWLSDGSGLVALIQEKETSYFQIWHLAYPGGEAKPLTNDSNNYTEFYLAPDDSFLVTTEEKTPYNIQLVSAENPAQVTSLTDNVSARLGLMGLEWTPDGKELVYLQLEGLVAGNLWKMNVETRETLQLTFDKGAWNRHPRVMPDGKSVIFGSNRSGGWHVWQVNLDGTDLRQITDGESEGNPQVSSDGNWLVYATPAISPDSLWKRPFNGGEPVKLLEHAAGISSISPDMTRIVAFYQDPNEREKHPYKYVLLPFEVGHDPKVLDFYGQHHVVRWKPDGSGIYFISPGQSHNNILFYNLADGKTEPITNFDSQEISNFALSPDGKTFAVARGKKTSNIFKISGF